MTSSLCLVLLQGLINTHTAVPSALVMQVGIFISSGLTKSQGDFLAIVAIYAAAREVHPGLMPLP